MSEGVVQRVDGCKAITAREVTFTTRAWPGRARLRGVTPTTRLWHGHRGVTPTTTISAITTLRPLSSKERRDVPSNSLVPLLHTRRMNFGESDPAR